jgi:hypothetical protein
MFAESRNKARYDALGYYQYWDDYIDIEATRRPEWDQFTDRLPSVVDSNDDLPDYMPRFFLESEE